MAKKQTKKTNPPLQRFVKSADHYLQRVSRQTRVMVTSVCVVLVLLFGVWSLINNQFLAPVHKGDKTAILVEIPRGSSVSAISKVLADNKVIRSATVFKLFVDIYDRGSKLKAGTYELNASMTVKEVLDQLSIGATADNVIKVLLLEGGTAKDLGATLKNLGLITDQEAFVQSLKDVTPYAGYAFLEEAHAQQGQLIVAMEGYLFPDTYQVFANATQDEIIKKFLTRFNNVYTAAYMQRATELGMTTDEVITLASMIQREAKTADFKKVSAVFHNRLKANERLRSDVTVQYALGISRLNLTAADIAVESPYNTYRNAGLPPGPICNPGQAAIEAALWPDESFISQGMFYFCLGDPKTGETVFAKTQAEHDANVKKYRPMWDAYDKAPK